jgi:hypothetical protein
MVSTRNQADSSCMIAKKEEYNPPCKDYFYKESYRLNPNCNIWVFDNLLSSSFLAKADEAFMNGKQRIAQFGPNSLLTIKRVRIHRASWSTELYDVLHRIANVRPIELPQFFDIGDVAGITEQAKQEAHIDVGGVQDFGDIPKQISLDKFQRDPDNKTVTPTFSFILYFNDVGAVVFPKVGEMIKARRGRIVMFQNYFNPMDKNIDCRAMHYGTYSTEPKRFAVYGMLTDTIPVPNMPKPVALIYSPNYTPTSSPSSSSWSWPSEHTEEVPATVTRPPGTLVWKFEKHITMWPKKSFWILHVIRSAEGLTCQHLDGNVSHVKHKYMVEVCQTNLFNAYAEKIINLSNKTTVIGFDSVSLQYHVDIDYELAVDEILAFIGLMQPDSRTGWICEITDAQRMARRSEWRSVGCTCLPKIYSK